MTLAEVSSVISGLFLADELQWNHTSASMCLLANVNASKGKSYKPQDFNPYEQMKVKEGATKQQAKELYETFKTF
jgi:hypothetical protein